MGDSTITWRYTRTGTVRHALAPPATQRIPTAMCGTDPAEWHGGEPAELETLNALPSCRGCAERLDLKVCPWCLEDAGWCEAAGGSLPCEGAGEAAAAAADLAVAPTVTLRVGNVDVAGGDPR
jgi:hypothetical protein